MRRSRGFRSGFAAALLAVSVVTPALADNRLFTFPDPAIVLVRRFEPQKIEMVATGPGPLARIMLPTTYPTGTQLRVQGDLTSLGGNAQIFFSEPASTSSFSLTSTGTFDQTITLTAAGDYIQISGLSYTSAVISSLTIDEVI